MASGIQTPADAAQSAAAHKTREWAPLPDHTQLPCSDGAIVENFQEHPQSILLTQSIWPVLQTLHPDGQFCVGQDSGIYWDLTDPVLKGCKAPDWFYVPNVPPTLNGLVRRSYVMWKENKAPLIVIEFVSGDGSEEHDRTPREGKFWVYEQAIRVPYYVIFDGFRGTLEVNRLDGLAYQPVKGNERGHFPIGPLNVEVGLWEGVYLGMDGIWLRFFDAQGVMLPSGEERTEIQRRCADAAQERAEKLAAKLRELGVPLEEV